MITVPLSMKVYYRVCERVDLLSKCEGMKPTWCMTDSFSRRETTSRLLRALASSTSRAASPPSSCTRLREDLSMSANTGSLGDLQRALARINLLASSDRSGGSARHRKANRGESSRRLSRLLWLYA